MLLSFEKSTRGNRCNGVDKNRNWSIYYALQQGFYDVTSIPNRFLVITYHIPLDERFY